MDSDATRTATTELKTVQETAQLLSLSAHTIRAWISSCELEHVRLGRSVRVPLAAIERLIRRGTVPARDRQSPTRALQA